MPLAEGPLRTADGLSLYSRWWQPPGEVRGCVALIHGVAEHCGRHAELAERLAEAGYAVSAVDLRGHGRSPGARCTIHSFDDYVADAEALLADALRRQPGLPLFLFGHSMGGAVAALYALHRNSPLSGIILSSPMLRLPEDRLAAARPLLGALSRLLPGLPTARVSAHGISRDPAVVRAYDSDPLVHRGRLPLRTGYELARATWRAQAGAPALRLPMLILQGGADRIVLPEGTRQFHHAAGSADKTLRAYPGFYHELFHEPACAQVQDDFIAWLDARTMPTTAREMEPCPVRATA